MFRLHRHKSDKSGEKIDFKFSHLNALQVPKGWDKLIVSMVSVETGKTTAKSGKALVRSGKCQWPETLSESIWISQDETSKELEQSPVKLVVSMGSSRSGILGETIINLTSYASSKNSVPVSLPLKKCNHGTVLQFKLQCLTPRATFRDAKSQPPRTSNVDNMNEEYDDMDTKSDTSDSTYTRSIGSSSSNHLAGNSHPGELGSRNTSFSASRHSSDSVEGSLERINFSPRHNLNGDNMIGAQESYGSPRNPIYGSGAVDLPRSNHSSFNSKFTGSGSNLQGQRQEFGQNTSDVLGTSSLRDASSKDLLEAAEETIEDLRAEARMWERNARKVMVDLEALRKEFADQSRNHANLDMELSAAHTERDGLKKEIEQLKILVEELKSKEIATENSNFQAEGVTHIQKELEAEIKFQKESSDALALQLQKTQESNLELVSILQELEETIEKQRLELNNLSEVKTKSGDEENIAPGTEDSGNLAAEDSANLALQLQELQESQKELQSTVKLLEETIEEKNREVELGKNLRKRSLFDIEADWTAKLSAKDEEINKLEAKISDLINAQCSHEMTLVNEGNSDMMRENETLKEKVQELEKDCNELTDENLELLFKLKESNKDHQTGGASFNSSTNYVGDSVSPRISEYEVELLRSQIHHLEQEMKNEARGDGATDDNLKSQMMDLQNKCSDLEIQLQSFRDKAHNLDVQLSSSQVKSEAQELEITTLKQQLQQYYEREAKVDDQLEKLELHSEEMCEFFQELHKKLQLSLAHVKKPWFGISSDVNTESENNLDQDPNAADLITQKEQAEAILNKVTDLNKILEAKIKQCEVEFQRNEAALGSTDATVTETDKNPEEFSLKENSLSLPIQEVDDLKMELEAKVGDLSKELVAKRSEIEELKAGLLSKEEEIEALRRSQTEFKAEISNLQKENLELEENLEIVSRESSITSKCLDEVRNDMMVLSSSLDSHVSANKMLERNSSELESGKRELELHLSELEEENVQLSERISGLEAQLRYLTDEKESGRLELENSKSLATDLRNDIGRLEAEIETQKFELKQKLQDMQKRWSEAQEECEYLKKANPKLQATAESLIEECSTTQRLNGELKKQKLELHERCTHLEAELRDSRKTVSECCNKIEILEAAYSSMQEEVSSKEKFLTAELDALFHENKEHKEKLILEESLLNQMYMEKAVEVENLQREVSHLTEQIGSTHDEREKLASNAVLEVSSLRVDKAKLESALQEAQAKFKSSETELHNLQLESRTKVQELIRELATSKNNQELLMADHEKLQRLLDNVKSSEERFKSTVVGLERKLSTSEYERQQQVEEVVSLKIQLQKIAQLQEEIVSLKNSFNEIKFEKSKVEASLQSLSEECEELKAERTSLVEKISSMQMSLSELDDCKRSRVALEEKLLRLEGDLTAKDALCAQDAELKNELNRVKRANSQLQRKVQCLEEEKGECLKKGQALKEELKSEKERKQQQSRSSSSKGSLGSESDTDISILHEELNLSEDDNKHHDNNGNHQVIGADISSKIQLLETELAEALEANEMYKEQLKKLLNDGQQGHAHAPKRSISEGVTVRKASSLEAELKDIRERYFHMSLRFAEVEAEREELVMKLKSFKSGKRWFS